MAKPSPVRSSSPALLRLLPTWKGSLIFFGVLIGIVLIYFYTQIRQAQYSFLAQAETDTRIIAQIIQKNAHRAVLAQNTIHAIMQRFLGNTARFVDYLDAIEPFAPYELEAFAQEAGLAGIRIVDDKGRLRQGPPGWFSAQKNDCAQADGRIHHRLDAHLYYFVWPRTKASGCILVGITAARIEKLQQEVGLPQLLKTLSGLGGIDYVRLEDVPLNVSARVPDFGVRLITVESGQVAEAKFAFENQVLVVGLQARHFKQRIRQLWREFATFGIGLAALGLFFAWLHQRLQTAHLKQVHLFEQKLALQREEAALGRAAAAITHEIRNPLNAISMGLQRLQLEEVTLSTEHGRLVQSMRQAVKRTNDIVVNIRRFARPIAVQRQPVDIAELIERLVTLYSPQGQARKITFACDFDLTEKVSGDTTLLEEVFENLLKNSIEAQPDGGVIQLRGRQDGSMAVIEIKNGGFTLKRDQTDQIFKPYFTTKTRGTGLGLAIAQRIVSAHKGRLDAVAQGAGTLCITIRLPIAAALSKPLKQTIQE
jgi:two-component system, NtrC family, sensor histidine kinase HydH